MTYNCDFLTLECDFQKRYEDYWFEEGKRSRKSEPTKPLKAQPDPPAKDFKINKAGGTAKRAYNKKSDHWASVKVPKGTFTPIGGRGPSPCPPTPDQTEKLLALEAQVELEQKEKEVWKER